MPTINRKSPDRPWIAKRKPFGTVKQDNYKFYNSKVWRTFATQEKMRYPLCDNWETCGGAHEITDHPTPISEGGHPFNQQMNHYCQSCNASKTGKQGHKRSGDD